MSALYEYTKLKYAGDCKCGECQLVPMSVVISTDEAHDQMLSALSALDAYWSEDFPGGPDGSRVFLGGLGQVSDDTMSVWRKVRAAIAKAEGRS